RRGKRTGCLPPRNLRRPLGGGAAMPVLSEQSRRDLIHEAAQRHKQAREDAGRRPFRRGRVVKPRPAKAPGAPRERGPSSALVLVRALAALPPGPVDFGG